VSAGRRAAGAAVAAAGVAWWWRRDPEARRAAAYRLAGRAPWSVRRRVLALPVVGEQVHRFMHAEDGSRRLAVVDIDHHGFRFQWQAPLRRATVARERGVENIITRLVRDALPPGGVGIDVGTNFGYLTTAMACRVGPGGRVIGFEVDPDVLPIVRGNIERNGLGDRAEIVALAAGNVVGPGATTVDAAVAERDLPSVDLVKVDTDGTDLDVLRGMAEVVERHHPTVVVETTEDRDAIVAWLCARYPHVTDMEGGDPLTGARNENVIASTSDLRPLLARPGPN
jgi:precorrin-6B methylase 2